MEEGKMKMLAGCYNLKRKVAERWRELRGEENKNTERAQRRRK